MLIHNESHLIPETDKIQQMNVGKYAIELFIFMSNDIKTISLRANSKIHTTVFACLMVGYFFQLKSFMKT